MKKIIFICLVCFSAKSYSVVVIWPAASAPCNATLQACINAASLGDVVEIRSNTPINETLFIDIALSVVAGIGYNPSFTSGNYLQLADASLGSARSVSIKGLTFNKGGIHLSSIGRSIIFFVENNRILDNIPNKPAISINAFSNDALGTFAQINFNHVSIDSSESTLFPLSAILITHDNNGVGTASGEIYNNTIKANGSDAIGIQVLAGSNANLDYNIVGNEIYGGNVSGIRTYRSLSSGISTFDIASNVIYPAEDGTGSSGIHIENTAGFSNADIINNTIIMGRYGVLLSETSGTLTARVYNNLVSFSTTQGFHFGTGVAVTNDYNLYYQNITSFGYTPGPNYVSSNPLILGLKNARLRPDSPALESGYIAGLTYVGDVPLVDADGLLRIKNSNGFGSGIVDIGAYEAGDVSFNHVNTTPELGHISTIDNPETNGLSGLNSLHVTANWNPDGATGIYNNDNEALYFTGGFWRVFNEAIVNILDSASFNLAKFASTGNTFEHLVTTSGVNNSIINNSGLDGSSDKILQLSQHWTGVNNPHPTGVTYLAGKWVVFNLDLNNIPINANFNVYFQDKSKSAYEHIAKSANIAGNYTFLNNPLINGIPCAQIQVTQSASQGVFNDSPIGVFYDIISNQWAIFNQDTSIIMPINAAFHVLINPAQIAQCSNPLLFKDGFE